MEVPGAVVTVTYSNLKFLIPRTKSILCLDFADIERGVGASPLHLPRIVDSGS